MIKLEALRTFITVAKAGNIAIAAEQLSRTPSAISMTLKALEESIGGALFETERKNALTPLGDYVLELSNEQIKSFDHLLKRIDDFAHGRFGRLSVSCVPSAAMHILPIVLPLFKQARDDVDIEIYDMDSSSVFTAIHSGNADIGISGMPPVGAHVDFEPLFRDQFVLVYNPDHFALDGNDPITWQSLDGLPLITNGASEQIPSPDYHRLAEQSTLRVRNISSLIALLNAGLGITALPALATLSLPAPLKTRRLEDKSAMREVGIVKSSARSYGPLMHLFRQTIIESLPEIAGQLEAIQRIDR